MLLIAPLRAMLHSWLMKEESLFWGSMSELAARATASRATRVASILSNIVDISGAGGLELQFQLIPPLGSKRETRRHDGVHAVP